MSLAFQDAQARIDTITADDIQNYRIAIAGMEELCLDGPGPPREPGSCPPLESLVVVLDEFAEMRSVDNFGRLLFLLFAAINSYTPWNTISLRQTQIQELQEAGQVTRIRGGVEYTSTIRFNAIGDENFERIFGLVQNVTAEMGGNPFDEYVFVSGGQSGSSGAVLPYSASQFYKNRDAVGTNRKVTLISYGGTGSPDDLTFANIPAGVDWVNLERPIIGDALIQL